MASTPTRNVALTIELEAYIKAQVASGPFSNTNEVARSALRLMVERDETRTMGHSHA